MREKGMNIGFFREIREQGGWWWYVGIQGEIGRKDRRDASPVSSIPAALTEGGMKDTWIRGREK